MSASTVGKVCEGAENELQATGPNLAGAWRRPSLTITFYYTFRVHQVETRNRSARRPLLGRGTRPPLKDVPIVATP